MRFVHLAGALRFHLEFRHRHCCLHCDLVYRLVVALRWNRLHTVDMYIPARKRESYANQSEILFIESSIEFVTVELPLHLYAIGRKARDKTEWLLKWSSQTYRRHIFNLHVTFVTVKPLWLLCNNALSHFLVCGWYTKLTSFLLIERKNT